MRRADVDDIVNGCDAGREGELIFAYIMDVAKTGKPVRRLWVSSMTKSAIGEGFEHLRDGEEMRNLEAAARSRSEADWLVGMNATRAATVRGRALGGVVSLGRVQTPTLALIVRRDLEIDAFEPETYFQVDARFGLDGPRTYVGRWFEGKETAHRSVSGPTRSRRRHPAPRRRSSRSSAPSGATRPPLLYDLTSLQRDANSRYGLSATRTLQAAQRLYEGSAAGAVITYPRTRSQFLPADQIPTLKGIARSLASIPGVRTAAEYVAGLDVLPLARVVNDARVDDHHAIIPTGEIPTKKLEGDDARVFDLVVRRFLAVFHPEAKFEDTEIITVAADHRFRTRGKRLVEAGWRGAAFGEEAAAEEPPGDEDEPRQVLPKVDQDERGTCEEAEVLEKQTKPPPRYSEASLLRDMETAGKQIEDEELRLAMKDAGPRHPGHTGRDDREAAARRLHRAAGPGAAGHRQGPPGDRHPARPRPHLGRAHRELGEAADRDRARPGAARPVHGDIRRFTTEVVEYFRNLTPEEVRAQRAEIGPCPNGDGIIRENRAAYGCSSWQSKEEPGCGFVIWKQQKGRGISPGRGP